MLLHRGRLSPLRLVRHCFSVDKDSMLAPDQAAVEALEVATNHWAPGAVAFERQFLNGIHQESRFLVSLSRLFFDLSIVFDHFKS